ncbi:MAG: site-2 protease family protein [Phycisphaeraceae bacterium]
MLDSTPIALIALILGFGFLIFVHELGHFLVARAVGIKCTQFAIGFGPSLLTWRKGIGFRTGTTEPEYQKRLDAGVDAATLGETEYRLNYLPLGGYVKMLGQEDLDPNAQSDDPRAFNRKPVWARACVISAGVVMNMIFGLLFLIAAFMAGVQFPPAIVGHIQADAPAAAAYPEGHEDDPAYRGLQIGDQITHIDGDEVGDFMEVRLASALGRSDTPIAFTIERAGVEQPLVYPVTPRRDPVENLLSVGIMPIESLQVAPDGVDEGSAAEAAGVQAGMWIVAVEGEPVENYGQYYRLAQPYGAEPFEVTFEDRQTGERIDAPVRSAPLLMGPYNNKHLAGLAPATRIGAVVEKSPAEDAGIEAGDLLARLGDERWPRFAQVPDLVADAPQEGLAVTVWRDGERVELPAVQPKRGLLGGVKPIGIHMAMAEGQPLVAQRLPDTPAASLDMPAGSRVVELAGQPVENWTDMQAALVSAAEAAEAGEPLEVEVVYALPIAGSPQETGTLAFTAEQVEQLASLAWLPSREVSLLMLRERISGENPIEATLIGIDKTKQFMQQTYVTLLRLIQGWISFEHLRGPVGIVDEGRQVAAEGWPYLFFFLGLISINLAIINFLPIPIVDGGLMVFLLLEKIKGSPAGPRLQTAATLVGLALIGTVFVTVTFYDIMRIAGG